MGLVDGRELGPFDGNMLGTKLGLILGSEVGILMVIYSVQEMNMLFVENLETH